MGTGAGKGHRIRETQTSKEFRDDLTALLSRLEGPGYLRVADAVIFSSDGFERFLGDYCRVVIEWLADRLRAWSSAMEALDALSPPSDPALLLALARAEFALEASPLSQAALSTRRRKLARAEAALARLRIDEELDAAAADLLERAAAAPEEEAADLRADAADLLTTGLRERVLQYELALRDVDAARAQGDLVSLEQLDADSEPDVPG